MRRLPCRVGAARRAIAVLIVFVGLASACGAPSGDTQAEAREVATVEAGLDQLERARASRVEGDYLVAQTLLRQAAAADPTDVDAQLALAAALASQHAFAEALELADSVIAEDPDHPGALALRGDVHLAIGQLRAAAEDHRRLHEVAPGPASLVRLAHGLEESGDPRTALQLVDQALAELERQEQARGVEPSGEAAAWFRWRLADLHRHLGDTETAAPLFWAALEIQPEYALAYDGLVDIALTEGRVDDAGELLDRWPAGSTIRVEAAIAVAEAIGDDDAVDRLRRDLIADLETRDRIAAGLDLAVALLDADTRIDEAVGLTSTELTRRTNAATLAVHARALLAADRADEALPVIERMLATGTNEPDRIAVAADVLRAVGQPERVSDLPAL